MLTPAGIPDLLVENSVAIEGPKKEVLLQDGVAHSGVELPMAIVDNELWTIPIPTLWYFSGRRATSHLSRFFRRCRRWSSGTIFTFRSSAWPKRTGTSIS